MSNAQEKIEEIIWGNCHDGNNGPLLDAATDAIIAALPDMVKPLEWTDYPMGSRCETDNDYSINYWEREKVYVDAYTTMRRHPTLEAAKAAAQAHHTAQIMAAFGIDAGAMKERKQ